MHIASGYRLHCEYLTIAYSSYSVDIAIGAPHANNLAGAVYIHYGSAKGLLAESSQILTPAGLGIPDVTSFGWSISKGFDLDNNNYNGS